MNFKTTIVLIALLAVAGLVVLLTNKKADESAQQTAQTQQKLLAGVSSTDVDKIVVTPADGKKIALAKDGANWKLTEPVAAPAQAFEVDSLVRAITELETTNSAPADAATGLDKPRYTIDLATTSGKSDTITVGDKTAVGDSLYVKLNNDSQAKVVSADLLEKISKPASTYRDPRMVDLSSGAVTKVTIKKPTGELVLAKTGENWNVVAPTPMPAEKSDVDDILFALTGVRAAEFVAEDTKDAKLYQLDQPRFTAILSSAPAPTTLPVGVAAASKPTTTPTSQPADVVIKFGRYDDVMKKNVLVTTSQTPIVAKVAATVIDTINKKPLDIRDRKVLDIDANLVSAIEIHSDIAATTRPTTKPAVKKDVTIKRRHEAAAPATAPSTKPAMVASTAPATKPAATTQATTKATTTMAAATTAPATQPATKWEVASGSETKAADDSKVDSLLSQLHPLRAQKYLEASTATTQPTATYTLRITTQAAAGAAPKTDEIRLVDPGNSQPLVGTYNGLTFEVDRFLMDRLSGDFLKGSSSSNEASPAPAAPEAPGAPFGAP